MAPLVASISETRHIAPRARVMPVDGARAPTRCEVCDCDVPARSMPTHERGARHRAKLRTRDSLTWRCVACDASMPARARFEHERTRAHRSNARDARDALLGAYRCDVCDVDVPACGREEHERGAKHRAATFRRSAEVGAEATPKETLVPRKISSASDLKSASVVLKLPIDAGEKVTVLFGAFGLVRDDLGDRVLEEPTLKTFEGEVKEGGMLEVENAVCLRDDWAKDLKAGVHDVSLVFSYRTYQDDVESGEITLSVLVLRLRASESAQESAERIALGPTSAFAYPKQQKNSSLVKGSKKVVDPGPSKEVLNAKTKFFWPAPLSVPMADIRKALDGEEPQASSVTEMLETGQKYLSKTNYAQFFRQLLMMEEVQATKNVRLYDMHNVALSQTNSKAMYRLFVPGLAEARPSVLRGDSIIVNLSTAKSSFRGKVEFVEAEHIVCRFHPGFTKAYINGVKADVSFEVSRTAIELMHGAIKDSLKSSSYESFLLPKFGDDLDVDATGRSDLKMLNRRLNEEQKLAVANAMAPRSQSPFIIFGPPGTGKTTTVVEIAAQMYKTGGRVLLMAPSNAACDLFISRVIEHGGVPKSEAYRVYNFSRMPDQVPSKLLDVSNYDSTANVFCPPTVERFMRARVVAMTPITAQRLTRTFRDSGEYGKGKARKVFILSPERRFENVIIDEAGHASEPELLTAIVSVLEPKKGRLVLAGDARQLGPLVQAKESRALEVSMLERLCLPPAPYTETPYSVRADGTFEPSKVCMLTKNYRSHACIIEIPSKLFYFDRLECCADPMRTNIFKGWEELPNPSFPVVFDGVMGEELREANSPSWFNPDEILRVSSWITKILDRKNTGLTAKDIAICTPYHKQKLKMMKHLEAKKISGVTVGSTELLQGQEFSVVILSTVRSDTAHLKFDARHRLGFMANPKRFNVAVTRAMSLLIIVGNPHILSHDVHWRSLIDYCRLNDSYTGCDFDGKPSAPMGDEDGDETLAERLDEIDRMLNEEADASYELVDPRDNE